MWLHSSHLYDSFSNNWLYHIRTSKFIQIIWFLNCKMCLNYIIYVCQRSLTPPLCSLIDWEESCTSAYSYSWARIHSSERLWSKISKGKNPEEIRHKFPRILSHRSPIGQRNFPQQWMWQHMRNIATRKAHQNKCPGFLIEAGPIYTLHLAYARIPDFQNESSVQDKPHCTNSSGSMRHF